MQVRTILSQNTTDITSQRAYTSLKHAFPDWERVRTAPPGMQDMHLPMHMHMNMHLDQHIHMHPCMHAHTHALVFVLTLYTVVPLCSFALQGLLRMPYVSGA